MLAGGAQAAGDGEAVHVRQHDVQHGEVGGVQLGGGQGVAAVAGRDHFEAGEAQGRGQQLADVGFIIDNEQLGFGTVLFHDSHDAPRLCEFSGWQMCVAVEAATPAPTSLASMIR